jgi:hypothetical protein
MNWQPIETAPKGQDVLVFDGVGKEQFVAFSVQISAQAGSEKHEWCFLDNGKIKACVKDPTHWTPLPPPPEDAQ